VYQSFGETRWTEGGGVLGGSAVGNRSSKGPRGTRPEAATGFRFSFSVSCSAVDA